MARPRSSGPASPNGTDPGSVDEEPGPLPADVLRRGSLVFLLGLVLIGASLGFPIAASMEDASIANPDETGAREAAGIVQTSAREAGSPEPRAVFSSLEAIPDPETDDDDGGAEGETEGLPTGPPEARTGVFVLGPSVPANEDEAAKLWSVMNASGTVIVADDTGQANALLRELPTTTRIDNATLIDVAYQRQPLFPVLFTVTQHPLTEDVDSVVANVAGAVRADANATRLVASSTSSWLDHDDNGTPSEGDERGPHTVMSIEPIGQGELVVLSDPSLVTNAMLGEADNAQLAANLADHVTRNEGQVYWDEGHRTYRPFALVTQALPAASAPTSAIVIGVLVGLPGLAWLGLRGLAWAYQRWLVPGPDTGTVIERTLQGREDWTEAEVRRVAEAIPTRPDRSRPNEREPT